MAPTHPFDGPKLSLEIKDGQRGRVLAVPLYDVLRVYLSKVEVKVFEYWKKMQDRAWEDHLNHFHYLLEIRIDIRLVLTKRLE